LIAVFHYIFMAAGFQVLTNYTKDGEEMVNTLQVMSCGCDMTFIAQLVVRAGRVASC
jgi:hypothetical protein